MRATYKEWTYLEEQALIKLAPLGAEHCAEALERSISSIHHKATQLRMRGVCVKFPRKNDGRNMGAAVETVRRLRDAPICPGCGKRPVNVPATGLCASCHYDRVVAEKAQRLEVEVARRRLDVIRHKRHRLRICAECGADFYPRKDSLDVLCEGCRS